MQNGELSQPFENKRKLINTNISIIFPSDTWGRVCMAFFGAMTLQKMNMYIANFISVIFMSVRKQNKLSWWKKANSVLIGD